MSRRYQKDDDKICKRYMYWQKWAKKLEKDELTEGMWFDPGKVLLKKRKVHQRWIDGHAAQAGCWIVRGAWTQKRLYDMNWAGSKHQKMLRSGRH